MAEVDRQYGNSILWNADTEVCLFYAMRGFKPVGLNKHFHMMGIHAKFAESLGQSVASSQLWEHLSTMYNLTVLDESQGLPFDNKLQEFKLPDDILNFGKEPEKPKAQAPVESTPEPVKIATSKEPQPKSNPPTKNVRKRTRAAPSQGSGAVGPGSSKRKRH